MKRTLTLGLLVFALSCWVTAAAAQQPVSITNPPVVESASANSAEIAWSTNTGGSSVVKYGTDPNNLSQTAMSPYKTGEGTHRVEIKGLQPNTTYYFQVVSGQGQGTGTQAMSQIQQFRTTGGASAETSGATSGDKVPLYRAYSPGTGSHLFTTNYQEYRTAVTGTYKDEGIAGYVLKNQAPGTEPLYRMTNASHDHFYTNNANERAQAISSGYRDEGIAGYIATTQQPGTVPLYRLVNPKSGDHFYTANPAEHQTNLQQGWSAEGIVGYIWQS